MIRFHSRSRRSTPGTRPRPALYRPRLEILEDRTAPAVIGGYTFNEFPLPTPYYGPDWLRPGPDGAVWFNQYPLPFRADLVRVATNGQFSAVQAPFPVVHFAFAPNGNIWVGGQTRIAEITQDGTLLHDYAIPSASPPGLPNTGIFVTVGPDGNVWYTEPYTSDLIGRLTPDGQITEYHTGFGNGGAVEIISGPDGNIWFEGTGASSIGRITLDGVLTTFNLPGEVRGLTASPDGNLWMTSNDRIFRVNIAGQLTGNFATPTPNSGAYQMTVGSDGALWFAEYGANQIGRITTDGSITEFPVTTGNYVHGAIVTTTDGNLWVSEFPSNSIAQIVLVPPIATLSGLVFADFNNDGQVDFGEQGLADVTVTLDGTDDLNQPVHLTTTTDADGTYLFDNLRPGTYRITETQPDGYTQGINAVGTAGGSVNGDTLAGITLASGQDGLNYNFGERPPSTGGVQQGLTASIGFWHNNNGQALIRSLNGGESSTHLGNWLAATLPNLYGPTAGQNALGGMTNADVAAYFQGLFIQRGPKVEAQLLATALAVYVTNATLNDTAAGAQYGFVITETGLGTATWDVGENGEAFGVANGTTLTVLDLLLRADAQSLNGILYSGNTARRKQANNVFAAINEAGDI